MQATWDETKKQTNIAKHGLDFNDAAEVFDGPVLEAVDTRRDYGEERWIGIGFLRGRVVVLVYTYLGEQAIRVISMRKAVSNERQRYFQYIQDRLGPGGPVAG